MELPLVLAGPIVRRVDSDGCSIWIALSHQRTATLTLWQGLHDSGVDAGTVSENTPEFAVSDPTELTQFGDRLYVGVITVKLGGQDQATMLPGAVYSYDVTFSDSGDTLGLRQLGLLEDHKPIPTPTGEEKNAQLPLHLALGYAPNRLPSFVTPPANAESLRLAHVSCRKSNGPSTDAMAWLDDQIDEHIKSSGLQNEHRLQQLFLTGDQIYADDLAGCLLPMLNDIGRELLGSDRREKITVGSTAFDLSIANFPPLRRTQLVRESAGFSSTSAGNHLIGFGEYAAMYLAAWSPHIWRVLPKSSTVLSPETDSELPEGLLDAQKENTEQIGARYEALITATNDKDTKEKHEKAKAKALKDRTNYELKIDWGRERSIVFSRSLPKVARAMANIATYMIFDDHDITDDWNLNQRWRTRVHGTAMGKAIIRNAMMAYGIFQAWGNDPAKFAKQDEKNHQFLSETRLVLGVGETLQATVPNGSTDTLDELISLTEAHDNTRATWNYLVKGPVHRVCVLDTRTRRRFSGPGISSPDLLGQSLKKQVPEADGSELLVLVSAVPVLDPHLIGYIGAPLYKLVSDVKYAYHRSTTSAEQGRQDIGAETADAESWAYNEVAREKLLNRLAGHRRVVILSGDVHYGATLRMDYWKGSDAESIPILQLTSSPSRNIFKTQAEALARHDARLQAYQDGFHPEVLGWNHEAPLMIPAGTKLDPGKRSRHALNPAILDSRNWPKGVSISSQLPPDWRWRVQLISDKRPSSALPVGVPTRTLPTPADELTLQADKDPDSEADPPPLPIATVEENLRRLQRLLSLHQEAALKGNFVLLRRVVFTENIGLVALRQEDDTLSVQHTLLSHEIIDGTDIDDDGSDTIDKDLSLKDLGKGVEGTVHQTSLSSLQADLAPKLVLDA